MNLTKHAGNIATDDDGRPNFAAETLPIVAPAETKPQSTYDLLIDHQPKMPIWLTKLKHSIYTEIFNFNCFFQSSSAIATCVMKTITPVLRTACASHQFKLKIINQYIPIGKSVWTMFNEKCIKLDSNKFSIQELMR